MDDARRGIGLPGTRRPLDHQTSAGHSARHANGGINRGFAGTLQHRRGRRSPKKSRNGRVKVPREVLHGDFGKRSLNRGRLYVLVRNKGSLQWEGTAELLFQSLVADLELQRALGRIKRDQGELYLKIVGEHDKGLSIGRKLRSEERRVGKECR